MALITIGKLYDDGRTDTFTETNRTVHQKVEIVLYGTLKGVAGMWQIHLATTPQPSPTPTHQSENNLMEERKKSDLERWYHATLFITVKQNLLQAIKK